MSTLPAKGYRTIGIDTQISWPSEEVVVDFRGRKLQLLPETEELSRMIRVETAPGFTQLDADKLILEFLSALAWAEQGGATPTIGNWCTASLNVGKGPRGGLSGNVHFNYLPDPPDAKAKLALALFREGLSANLIPYKVLGFFKIINIIRDKGRDQIQWMRDNLRHITDKDAIARVAAIRNSNPDVAEYLYVSGRCAVAHAFDQNNVANPDDPADLIRLHEDLPVIRELARIAIERECGVVSQGEFHRQHLYELEGFRELFGEILVGGIKALEDILPAEMPVPKVFALRIRDRGRIELFESMDASIVYIRAGCVRVRLRSQCTRLTVFVSLDFLRESLVSDPLADVDCHDDGTPDAAKMMLQWVQLHRWWFGGNGAIELWDTATGTRMARGQPYMPPVNSRFPHEEFTKMEAELQARMGASDSTARANR